MQYYTSGGNIQFYGNDIDLSKYNKIAFRYNTSGESSLFLNGVKIRTSNVTTSALSISSLSFDFNGSEPFYGKVKELKVFNKALTDQELISLTNDHVAPVLTQVTAIATPSSRQTPSFVFTTTKAGTITTNISQGFSTSSNASVGSNQTITFNQLPDGTYSGKTITVTDPAGNTGSLTIPDFVVDSTLSIVPGLLSSLQSRVDYYENETSSKTILESIEDI